MVAAVPILSGLLEMKEMYSPAFMVSLRDAIRDFPEARWEDALSLGQIRSKVWLVEKLTDVLQTKSFTRENDLGEVIKLPYRLDRIYICASWYGVLAEMLMRTNNHRIERIRGIDLDLSAVEVANRLLKHRAISSGKVKTAHGNINDLKYEGDMLQIMKYGGEFATKEESADTIINTSCEHIDDFQTWWNNIPVGKLVIIQSNDFFDHPEHINCVENLSEFAKQSPMSFVWFEGMMELSQYTRFMRIGIK